ncbi:maltase 1 [Neodiprion lecontei]|uniref:alpha-glucosidase n=1 Tax=Neodiprion lecontei TaxID=441921 RepID=A0A6J0BWX2_NEOLC|nr:maltase 1 [Neodiprion lecontei]XP_046588963.1 maltase 1 [Neodiprion lecontei]
MSALRLFYLILAVSASIHAITYNVTVPTEWWQTNVMYEIWIESFKDSDGNGKGDLNGIKSKLDHFVDMGVTCIWLPPIYETPMVDSGYDISNFIAVNSLYGTLDDFDALVTAAHKLGLKVIIDFVPNHTSDEHEWFVKAKQGIEPYYSYYVWNKGVYYGDYLSYPNNWLDAFNDGTVWEWVDEREAYYLHQFSVHEVDLNWRNPFVMTEMKNVLTFWLDRNVDGFRIDAVPYYVESSTLENETRSDKDVDSTNYFYLNHTQTKDQPENYPIVQEWKEHINNYTVSKGNDKVRFICTEGYSDIDYVMKWYDYGDDFPFNLNFIRDGDIANEAVLDTAEDIYGIYVKWLDNMPSGKTANWVLGNHDFSRIATRIGLYRTDGFHMSVLLMPGVFTMFNGDELGMTDTYLTWEETIDHFACSTTNTTYSLISRDPWRTPYQWDNTTSAGFSTNSTPFLKVNPNYLTVNLATEKEADFSHYKNIQQAIALRNTTVWREGTVDVELIEDQVVGIARQLDGEEPIVVLINWENSTVTVDLDNYFDGLPDELSLKIADIYSGLSAKIGDTYSKSSIELPEYGSMVLLGTTSA